MSIRARLARGSIWVAGARTLVNFLGFAGTLVLARVLMPADFGLVALGTTIMAVVDSLTDVKLPFALVQHRNPSRAHLDTVWTMSTLRSAIIALAVGAFAWPAALIFSEPRLAGVMLVLAVAVLFNGMANPRALLLTRELVFWQQFVLQVSQKLLAFIISVAVALIFRSYWAIVAGAVTYEVSGTLISFMILPYRPRPTLRHWRELMGFSVWLTLGYIVTTLSSRLDNFLVGGFLGKTTLGYLSVADTVAAMPTREAVAPLTNMLFPAFTHLVDDPARLARAYRSAQGLLSAVALPVGVGVSLLADPIVRLTMSEKWLPAVPIIQVLSTLFALQTIGILAVPLALALGETRLLFKRDLQSFVIRVPFSIAGMLLAGLWGMIGARALTTVVLIGFNMLVVRKLTATSLGAQIMVNLRALIAVAIMGCGVLLLDMVGPHGSAPMLLLGKMAVFGLVGAMLYCGTMVALWMLAGRPDGPEHDVLALIRKLGSVVRHRSVSL